MRNAPYLHPRLDLIFEMYWTFSIAKCSGSVGRALDLGSKCFWFEHHRRCSHCVMFLGKTIKYLFNPVRPDKGENVLTRM